MPILPRLDPIIPPATRRLRPTTALAWLWLGTGVLAMWLFPTLRGSDPQWGWWPLWTLLMPSALLLVLLVPQWFTGSRGTGSIRRAPPAPRRLPPARRRPRAPRARRLALAALLPR